MAGIEDGEIIALEECMTWLPSHVLNEALFDCATADHNIKQQQQHHHHHYHHRRGGRIKPTVENPPPPHPNSKLSFRNYHRPKYHSNWQSEGMQAFFLVSGRKSSGTGVFLPAIGSQAHKKPACSPVLLPSRVVQALNLNVNSLGLQVSPQQGRENNSKRRSKIEAATRKCGDVTSNNSPEIFLPKEWTY